MYCVGQLKSYALITSYALKSEARLLTELYGINKIGYTVLVLVARTEGKELIDIYHTHMPILA